MERAITSAMKMAYSKLLLPFACFAGTPSAAAEVKQAVIYNARQMYIPVQALQLVTEQGNY